MNVTISSLKTHHKYINRDLSWLQFNARVLQEAEDPLGPSSGTPKGSWVFFQQSR